MWACRSRVDAGVVCCCCPFATRHLFLLLVCIDALAPLKCECRAEKMSRRKKLRRQAQKRSVFRRSSLGPCANVLLLTALFHASIQESRFKSKIAFRTEGPPENWISAAANQPCDTACLNAGFDECGQEEMAAINSTATLSTLLSLLNLTCTPPATGSPFRDGGGSPFTTTSGSCYYWDPTEPASSVDCSTVQFSSRQPLCYCKNST